MIKGYGINTIALVIDSLQGGGAEKNVLKIATKFSQMGLNVHLICTEKVIDYSVPEGLNIHFLSKSRKITGYKFIDRWILSKRFKKLINRLEETNKFDIIISHMRTSDFIVRLSGVKGVYYSIRNNMSSQLKEKKGYKYPLSKWQVKRIYAGQDLITVSEGVKRDIVDNLKIPVKSIRTIYNPFDFSAIIKKANEPLELEISNKYIIHVGSFKKQKRHDILFKAYEKANIPHKLVLVGGGSETELQDLKQLAEELNILDKLYFAGWRDNPYQWIKNASLFVLSSDYEGLPTVIIESLVCGTPVVSTDCPSGPQEILTGNLSQYLVPVEDIDALSKVIKVALKNSPKIDIELLSKFEIDYITKQFMSLKIREII